MNDNQIQQLTHAIEQAVDYEGDYTFHVKASELTKLTPGSTFRCYIIEQG